MTTLIASDLHLSERTWEELPGVRGDAYFALDALAGLCERHHASRVVLAGDVFDTPRPSPADFRHFQSFCRRLADLGVGVLFVDGQHDRSRWGWGREDWVGWAALAGAAHAHGESFELEGLRAYGLDFQPPEQLAGALACVPAGTDVLVCHQRWRELQGGTGSASLRDVPHAVLVFSGDLHVHTRVEVTRPDGTSLVACSPGSTHCRSVDEPPDKYAYLVEAPPPGAGPPSVTGVSLPSRPVRRCTVMNEKELRALLDGPGRWCEPGEGLPESVARPVLEVRLARELAGAAERLRKELSGRAHLLLRPAGEDPSGRVTPVQPRPAGPLDAERLRGLVLSRPGVDADLAGEAVDLLCRPGALDELEARVEDALRADT